MGISRNKMPTKQSPWTSIHLPTLMVQDLDEFLKKDICRRFGIMSRADLAARIVGSWLANYDSKYKLFEEVQSTPIPAPPPQEQQQTSSFDLTDFINKIINQIPNHRREEFYECVARWAEADRRIEEAMELEDQKYEQQQKKKKEQVQQQQQQIRAEANKVFSDMMHFIEETGEYIKTHHHHITSDVLSEIGKRLDNTRMQNERYMELLKQEERELFKEEISAGKPIPEWWRESEQHRQDGFERAWKDQNKTYRELVQEFKRLEQAKEEKALKQEGVTTSSNTN